MSFGQRFIYVGVGGSGQTIGRELEGMLRNQICGPNGNKARLEEKKLPELRAHELPRFIQTIYVDFAESDHGCHHAWATGALSRPSRRWRLEPVSTQRLAAPRCSPC